MIKRMQKEDVDRVAGIWLETNVKAHHFIAPQYWKDNFTAVKEQLSRAEVYVWEDEPEKEIRGFVGLSGNYIAGIFVQSDVQSRGIGKMLTDYAKSLREQLTLSVYQKNTGAVRFYQREGFFIQREGADENTGEKEYVMLWSREAKPKQNVFMKKSLCLAVLCLCVLTGCSGSRAKEKLPDTGKKEDTISEAESDLPDGEAAAKAGTPFEETPEKQTGAVLENPEDNPAENAGEQPASEPEIIRTDWSEYFDGMNGSAVLYDPSDGSYRIYNQELAQTRRSPCSTFKIVSSLIALENGILDPAASTRKWSGEAFWNDAWNQDMDFSHAFRESCVWYFREVIDETGQEKMQDGLLKLSYGNCDISDWEGRLNTNNNNRALTGFWLESSLAISPMEQAEVMERIFGEASAYSEESREQLKQVMSVPAENGSGPSVYGKTGMGKAEGVVVDAWYTGFAENEGRTVYFCVYLGRTDDRNVSSTEAKEIAIGILSDYYKR